MKNPCLFLRTKGSRNLQVALALSLLLTQASPVPAQDFDVKLLKTLQAHSYWIRFVSFSPNGRLLASGSGDNTVKLWNVETERELLTLKGHSNVVSSVTFSPDGRLLASGSRDKTIKLWEIIPQRGLPPDLHAELDFRDEDGSGILEATESASIEIKLFNWGKGPAQRLVISVEDDHPDPALRITEQRVWILPSSDSIKVTIPIRTDVGLKTADHRLKINVREYFGYDMDPAYLLLSTQAYRSPKLTFSGLAIADTGEGTFARVEDGQLQAGEQVKVNLVVQNIGQGVAKNVTYQVASVDENIYIEEYSGTLGTLQPGEVKDFWVLISPNKRVTTQQKLPIYLTLEDSLGLGNLQHFQLPLKLNQKPPAPNIIEVKPDLEKLQRQIARFETQSPKFTIARQLREMQYEEVQEKMYVVSGDEALLVVYTNIDPLNFECNLGIIQKDIIGPGEYRLHLNPGTNMITYKAPGYRTIKKIIYIPKKDYKEVKVMAK